ncbi:MAG: ABC transporter substrate-binding protein [Campylobacterota bacterium]|nr:ABC transporter substrate-binding protein [Campylobacterota bacterium]
MSLKNLSLMIFAITFLSSLAHSQKVKIKAVGIPLADHYAAIIAYEKYRDSMQKAKFELKILPGPNLVRRYFRSMPDTDIALTVAPMVMDMFAQKPNFRWISLLHRDGNALVVNNMLAKEIKIDDKNLTVSNSYFANSIKNYVKEHNRPIEIAIPSLLATHTTILYKYLKDHNLTMGLYSNDDDVKLHIVKPLRSIAYLKSNSHRQTPVAFEQSLPWPQIVQSQNSGKIVWYSKDVMRHDKGHVECIIIAKDSSIIHKKEALKEVIYYIHRAARDIEEARNNPQTLESIIQIIRKHIPAHTPQAIKESLRSDRVGINYLNLNIDANAKKSFKEIMELAFEAGFIKSKIDIEALANQSFDSNITTTTETQDGK